MFGGTEPPRTGERAIGAVDAWVERWLSAERFATYLAAAGGDSARALRLYEWNACVSAALLHDLAHLEVGLRNAYDRALFTRVGPGWADESSPLFAGRAGDRFREQLRDARDNAVKSVGPSPARGDVVAQLGFGFWRFLSAKAQEKTFWVPALHTAFPLGTDRAADVDAPLARLHKVRNRVAHHEPLLKVDLLGRLADVVTLATRLDPDLGRYVRARSTVAAHVQRRP